MRKTLITTIFLMSAIWSYGQDSCAIYRAKADSFQRAYKNLVKLDNLRRVSVLKHARIVQHNPSQAKFIVGWATRDLR